TLALKRLILSVVLSSLVGTSSPPMSYPSTNLRCSDVPRSFSHWPSCCCGLS
ncbi:hypothetical protein BGX38DRAFT_1210028, partial [Terfezia claveryi]